MSDLTAELFRTSDGLREPAAGGRPQVVLTDWDPEGEDKVVAAMLYPYTDRSEGEIARLVAGMTVEDRLEVIRRYTGDRDNRRHRPGRALERSGYRFDVISDYGAFRDLQRHRLLTVEWQELTPGHGFAMPEAIAAAGAAPVYEEVMERSAELHHALTDRFCASQAAYAVALAYRIRYVMQFNAREAMHMLELRTTPQGHPEYRQVCQQMYRLIAEQAGHRALAAMMSHVDLADYEESGLERLAGERRAEVRRGS
jgi:hypothetical protein